MKKPHTFTHDGKTVTISEEVPRVSVTPPGSHEPLKIRNRYWVAEIDGTRRITDVRMNDHDDPNEIPHVEAEVRQWIDRDMPVPGEW